MIHWSKFFIYTEKDKESESETWHHKIIDVEVAIYTDILEKNPTYYDSRLISWVSSITHVK